MSEAMLFADVVEFLRSRDKRAWSRDELLHHLRGLGHTVSASKLERILAEFDRKRRIEKDAPCGQMGLFK